MDSLQYWRECLESSFAEHGVSVTPAQLAGIALDVAGAHECYGMAFYSPPAGEHLVAELDATKRALETERGKVDCRSCNGKGRVVTAGPYHNANSHCDRCGREGRVSP